MKALNVLALNRQLSTRKNDFYLLITGSRLSGSALITNSLLRHKCGEDTEVELPVYLFIIK